MMYLRKFTEVGNFELTSVYPNLIIVAVARWQNILCGFQGTIKCTHRFVFNVHCSIQSHCFQRIFAAFWECFNVVGTTNI